MKLGDLRGTPATPVLSAVVGIGISISICTLIPSMFSPKPDHHIYSCLRDFLGVEEGSVVNENKQRKTIFMSEKKLTFSSMNQKGANTPCPSAHLRPNTPCPSAHLRRSKSTQFGGGT